MIFCEGGPIDYGKNVPVPVAQSSAVSEYNVACTLGMDLSHFKVLIDELLNKDPNKFLEEAPLIILDIKSAVFMDKNGKDTKDTRHIYRRVHLVRNSENFKMKNIDWHEGDLQMADIATKNVGENDLNLRMNYIMFRLGN